MSFDVSAIRRQFPILSQKIGVNPLIYLDSAATSQKPLAVLEAMDTFSKTANANVHRGMHALAEAATDAYEGARKSVQHFLNAKHADEIIFTKSTTEAINLVAKSWGKNLAAGDAIVLTILEHHSNIVPWLQLKDEKKIDVHWIDCDDAGNLNLRTLDEFLAKKKVKLVCVTGLSNVLGTKPDLASIVNRAHAAGARVLVDAAQLAAHEAIDVQKLDCDFLALSGHKIYGPTGIGVLYGKREILKDMPPFLGGGMMIGEVTQDHFTAADPPQRFEAGTPPIAEAVGLHAAIEWMGTLPRSEWEAHERDLVDHAGKVLSAIPGLYILGHQGNQQPANKLTSNKISGCLSFTLEGMHPHDLTDLLGKQGICLRAGHHCTQPLHRRLGITASVRLSVAVYNTKEEIDATAEAIRMIQKKFLSSPQP